MLDCLIRGGTVIDGTGRPAVRADVGIRDGRIASVGDIDESATRTIDAEGRMVAPGFIDMHTHIDAQVMWEPELTPTSLHGVTTVIGGNCGFAIAPIDDKSGDYVMRMLSAVEGMPVKALETGLDLNWRSYDDWLDRIEGKASLNCGFLAGHSTIRRLVMGGDWQQPASESQVKRMAEVLDQSLNAGALGFSSSWNEIHADHQADPVPSRFAEPEELVQLAGVLRDRPGVTLGFQAGSWPLYSERAIKVMADMSVAAAKKLNWNALTVGTGVGEEAIRQRLTSCDYAAERGGRVYGLLFPSAKRSHICPLTAIFFHMVPNWSEVFGLPLEERIKALADPAVRQHLTEGYMSKFDELRYNVRFDQMSVASVESPGLKPLEGREVSDIARERGVTPLELFYDLCVEDKMRVSFLTELVGDDDRSWELRKEFWNDPRCIIGGSDAGAHLDSLDAFTYITDFVGPTVRDRKLLSLEEAVYRITDAPARFNELKERGRLQEGWHADVVIFDPATVRPQPTTMRPDMPGGESRIYAGAIGIERVMVNGVEVVVEGKPTGATPGTLMRSGRDTGEA